MRDACSSASGAAHTSRVNTKRCAGMHGIVRAAAEVVSSNVSRSGGSIRQDGQQSHQRRVSGLEVSRLSESRMRDSRMHVASLEDTDEDDENVSSYDLSEKEKNRRKKISQANKGKVPWNKGKNMTEEMKAKISQRTYEAMQRPDVRARMKKANANRAPHSEEVRKRIREVLRKRADEAKAIIADQTVMILDDMEHSKDENERSIVGHKDAHDVIGRLAWRLLHRDFETMHEKWQCNTDGFRDAVVARFQELESRKLRRRKRAPSKKKLTSKASSPKLKAAEDARNKLAQAEEKLQSVEQAIVRLQDLKVAYKDRPESLSVVLQKESQTTELLCKLREQVNLLHQAMAPFENSLDLEPSQLKSENSLSSTSIDSHWDKDDAPSKTNVAPITQLPWGKATLKE
jgi:hypothetical protein